MLVGHKRLWNFLRESANKNKLAHAYLFCGPSEIGKKTLALEFIKWLLCQDKRNGESCGLCRSCSDIIKNQHPDVFFLAPQQEEKRGVVKTYEIGINEIKTLQHQLSLSSFSAPYKVALIDEADQLTREAISSFLKTLEEPTPRTLIILITSRRQAILSTIISRCQVINFLPVAGSEIFSSLKKIAPKNLNLNKIVKLAAGRPGRAIKLIKEPDFLNQQEKNFQLFKKLIKADLNFRWELVKELASNISLTQETLDQWILWLRDQVLDQASCSQLTLAEEKIKSSYSGPELISAIRAIQKTRAILENSSFDSRLALENLMLKI